MNLQQVRLAARVLVLIPIGTAAIVGVLVGGRNGLVAAAVAPWPTGSRRPSTRDGTGF